MTIQIQTQKMLKNIDFLTSTVYEKYDLRGVIAPGEKVVVRQGDLIVTNYTIFHHSQRGLSRAYLRDNGKYYIFRESHVIMPAGDSTILFHNEHGLVILPISFESLHFYTFVNASD